MRIPLYVFHCINSMQTLLCKCHRSHSVVRILLCAFYCVHSNVCLPTGAFPRVHSIACVPLYAFHRVRSIVCIPSCNRRRKEEIKEDGWWMHWRFVFTFPFFVAAGINRDASTRSVLSESPLTGSASTRLYQSHFM